MWFTISVVSRKLLNGKREIKRQMYCSICTNDGPALSSFHKIFPLLKCLNYVSKSNKYIFFIEQTPNNISFLTLIPFSLIKPIWNLVATIKHRRPLSAVTAEAPVIIAPSPAHNALNLKSLSKCK